MRITRSRLIVLAVALAVLVAAVASFTLLGGWRLLDPYAGKVVDLRVGVPTGIEARWRSHITYAALPSLNTPLLRKLMSPPRPREHEIVTRLCSLETDEGERLIVVLVNRSHPGSGPSRKYRDAELRIARADTEGRAVRWIYESQSRNKVFALTHERPMRGEMLEAYPKAPVGVGATWRSRKEFARPTGAIVFVNETTFGLKKLNRMEGRLSARVTAKTKAHFPFDPSSRLTGTAEFVLDLERGVVLQAKFGFMSRSDANRSHPGERSAGSIQLESWRKLSADELKVRRKRIKSLRDVLAKANMGQYDEAFEALGRMIESESDADWIRGLRGVLKHLRGRERQEKSQQKKP